MNNKGFILSYYIISLSYYLFNNVETIFINKGIFKFKWWSSTDKHSIGRNVIDTCRSFVCTRYKFELSASWVTRDVSTSAVLFFRICTIVLMILFKSLEPLIAIYCLVIVTKDSSVFYSPSYRWLVADY